MQVPSMIPPYCRLLSTCFRSSHREYLSTNAQHPLIQLSMRRLWKEYWRNSWRDFHHCQPLRLSSMPRLECRVFSCLHKSYIFLDIDDHVDGIIAVFTKELIDVDICFTDLSAWWIPSNDLLLGVNFPKQRVHGFMVVVVKEPDLWITRIFFKRNSITITDLQNSLLAVLT